MLSRVTFVKTMAQPVSTLLRFSLNFLGTGID
jgi:hypothetical protein